MKYYYRLLNKIEDFIMLIRYNLCDHAVLDNQSSIGPDSGHEHIICMKCGCDIIDHTYY